MRTTHVYRFAALVAASILAACVADTGSPSQPQPAPQPTSAGGYSQAQICKAATAVLDGEQVWKITARDVGQLASVSYDSARGLVQLRCKLEGNRILWAPFEGGQAGPWQTKPVHGVMTFEVLQSGALFVWHQYADGTAYRKSFAPRELR